MLLDRGYVSRVIGYPRDEKGRLEDDGRPEEADVRPHGKIWDALRKEGWRDWRIAEFIYEREVAAYLRSQADHDEHMQLMEAQHGGYPGQPWDAAFAAERSAAGGSPAGGPGRSGGTPPGPGGNGANGTPGR